MVCACSARSCVLSFLLVESQRAAASSWSSCICTGNGSRPTYHPPERLVPQPLPPCHIFLAVYLASRRPSGALWRARRPGSRVGRTGQGRSAAERSLPLTRPRQTRLACWRALQSAPAPLFLAREGSRAAGEATTTSRSIACAALSGPDRWTRSTCLRCGGATCDVRHSNALSARFTQRQRYAAHCSATTVTVSRRPNRRATDAQRLPCDGSTV
jgi:hypothetical protein